MSDFIIKAEEDIGEDFAVAVGASVAEPFCGGVGVMATGFEPVGGPAKGVVAALALEGRRKYHPDARARSQRYELLQMLAQCKQRFLVHRLFLLPTRCGPAA